MKPALLVLAAGMGSRYGGLKQIDPVGENGETIIDFSIYDSIKSDFNKIVFIIRKDIEKEFRDIIGKKYENKTDVEYVFQQLDSIPGGFSVPSERTKPWGTGHAILCARSAIKSPFAVINGDDFYGSDSFHLLGDYLKQINNNSNDYAIMAYILKNTLSEHGFVSRGVCGLSDGNYLDNIVERTKIKAENNKIFYINNDETKVPLTGNEFVSMNMFGFTTGVFEYLQQEFINFLKSNINDPKSEFYIPSVVSFLIKNSLAKVKVLQSKSKWLGITYQEDKEEVKNKIRELVKKGEYPGNLWV